MLIDRCFIWLLECHISSTVSFHVGPGTAEVVCTKQRSTFRGTSYVGVALADGVERYPMFCSSPQNRPEVIVIDLWGDPNHQLPMTIGDIPTTVGSTFKDSP